MALLPARQGSGSAQAYQHGLESALMTVAAGWLGRLFGRYTWMMVLLLLISQGSFVYGLYDANHNLDLFLLVDIAVSALLVGWLLARSKIPSGLVWIFGSITGLATILLRSGRLSRLVLLLVVDVIKFSLTSWGWVMQGRYTPFDLRQTGLILYQINGNLISTTNRIEAWIFGLVTKNASFDALAASFLWAFILWSIAFWSAWMVRRKAQPVWALAPSGILLAAAINFTRQSHIAILPLLGSAILMMIVVNHWKRESQWINRNIDYSTEIRSDLAITTIPLVAVLLTTAIIAPSISIRKLVEYAQQLAQARTSQVEQVGESLGLEPGYRKSEDTSATAEGLPRSHLLGSGQELSKRLVMAVQVTVDQPDLAAIYGPRYYWRSQTFDEYTGRGWKSSTTQAISYQAGEFAVPFPLYRTTSPQHMLVNQSFRGYASLGGVLYVAEDLLTADRDFLVNFRIPREQIYDSFGALIGDNSYHAQSIFLLPDQASLRIAGSDYPDWVRDRYLVLPNTIPERVQRLAQSLVANQPTPYEKALAIEAYLRNIPYSLDIPVPPPGRDVVDYFLFDLIRGYCDYYATAMVVLTRSVGVPSRLVTGYAVGSYDEDKRQYIVTEADAHSWVEVYFPGMGWVEFEPTANQSAIQRPVASIRVDQPPVSLPSLRPRWYLREQYRLFWWAGGLVVFLVFGLLIIQAGDAWWLRRIAPVQAVSRLYRRLRHSGQRVLQDTTTPILPGDTPFEFARTLVAHAESRSGKFLHSRLFLPLQREVERLVQLYQRTAFSLHPPTRIEHSQALHSWRSLRWRLLWVSWIKARPATRKKNIKKRK